MNGLRDEEPLGGGIEIKQFPAGNTVSALLAGEQREGQQRKASEVSDVFPIVGSKSISDMVKHKVLFTNQCPEATEDVPVVMS